MRLHIFLLAIRVIEQLLSSWGVLVGGGGQGWEKGWGEIEGVEGEAV